MSEQPAGEKSFAPSAKRQRDAAQKGDVLRSKEVATALAVLIGALWLKLAGPWLFGLLAGAGEASLNFDRGTLEDFAPGAMLAGLVWAWLPALLSLGLPVIALTMAVQVGLADGGRFVPGNAGFKGSRLDPLKGLGRMFGVQGLIELAKGVAKLAVLGAIAWVWAAGNLASLLMLGRGELTGQLAAAWDAMAGLLLWLSAGLVVIALIDWPIQLLRRTGRLKMTLQEVRDEQKEAEGSPERRMAIRQRQRDLARGGVASAMREAQFVLANPSHFSVAMTYDPALASAPVVLAKGRGDKALAMRDIAAEMGVPVLEYPLLARAVYFTTRENQVIRAELYAAIASVLAFVLSLKRGDSAPRPVISLPREMQFDPDGRPLVA